MNRRLATAAAVALVMAGLCSTPAWADSPRLRFHLHFAQEPYLHEWYGPVPYDPYWAYPPPYAYPLPRYGFWSGAPLYLPPETLYGPEAVRRFMGVVPNAAPRQNILVVPENNADPPVAQAPAAAPNPRSAALSRRLIELGDAEFAQQKFATAYLRYKEAVKAAPQLADGYFRQGFALVATGKYDWAARAFKRGLELEPRWAASGFRIDALYGNSVLAKQAHLDTLAQAALDDPDDADLLFLLGVMLHGDGQGERAELFFQRALELSGPDAGHLRAFRP